MIAEVLDWARQDCHLRIWLLPRTADWIGGAVITGEPELYHVVRWEARPTMTRQPFLGDDDINIPPEGPEASPAGHGEHDPALLALADGQPEEVDFGADDVGENVVNDSEDEDANEDDGLPSAEPDAPALNTVDGLLESMELVDQGDSILFRGTPCGKLHVLLGSTGKVTFKATCSAHSDCAMWLTAGDAYFLRYGIVLRWLKEGLSVNAGEHLSMIDLIKDELGIVRRGPRPANGRRH